MGDIKNPLNATKWQGSPMRRGVPSSFLLTPKADRRMGVGWGGVGSQGRRIAQEQPASLRINKDLKLWAATVSNK